MRQISIVLCGLRFGGAFVPIYRDHPDVKVVGLYDPDESVLTEVSQHYGINRVYKTLQDVLNDDSVDAVHLISPIPLHDQQAVQVLRSGKHCACTVPMALTLQGLEDIIEACEKYGKKYMMMETTAYTRQFLTVRDMMDRGELGRIQFLRGCHYQDMENWPEYWMGLPPMHYATHAISPMVLLAGSPIERVMCFGSGQMRASLQERYGNPYPIESALFAFSNGLKGEVTRSLFETARTYLEGMYVYGSKASFEWGFADDHPPIVTRLVPTDMRGFGTPYETLCVPPHYQGLPEAIQRYTVSSEDYDETRPENSLSQGAAAGHHGSHPHLVHEFVRSVIENRKPAIDERLGANITAAGICAHQSAMSDGREVKVPTFL